MAQATAIRLVVNGDARVLSASPPTIAALVRDLGLEGQRVAVEVNGDVVTRAEHGTRPLKDGDRVAIEIDGIGRLENPVVERLP